MSVTLAPEAARLFQQIRPVAGEDDTAAHLCAALMAPVELSYQLGGETTGRPGQADLLDVDTVPAVLLPWLGQFNGTPLQAGEPEEEQRRKIREARGSHRGTVPAVISDLKATLTGTQYVQLIERYESPFENLFITEVAETPDVEASEAALNDKQTKPLGVVNRLITSNAPLIDQGTRTIDASEGTIDTATLADIT